MNNPRQNGPDYAVSYLRQVWQKIERNAEEQAGPDQR